jgi:hypothetical protein
MTMMNWKKRAAAAAAAVASAGLALDPAAAARTAAPAAPKPALWKLADADTNIYLFGTIHALPKDVKWRTPLLERAIGEADELVLEIGDATDTAKAAAALAAMGVSPGLPPLVERLPEAKRPALQKFIEKSQLPMKLLNRLETWAAAMTLIASAMRGTGFSRETGTERGLESSFKAAGKPISGLETVEQQLGFFDGLSEESQRAFLADAVLDAGDAKALLAAMVEAWTSGDTDAIARTFDDETELSPELREVLMRKRNAAWTEWLAKRLERPGTVLVAVGAGHLAGRDSVREMLEARGLKAERVQ